jgi:uncharacterized membrane protein
MLLRYLTAYVSTAAILFTLDLLWIGRIAADFYKDGLGPIMLERPNIAVAVAFYVLYVIGLVLFVVGPALSGGGWRQALLWGALFGLFAYGTYDLTNLATLRDFPLRVAAVDMAWGTALSGISAAGGVAVARWILARLGAES